jgi:multimeric flavodoxin WrbA
MSKKIMILNGSPRENGNTAALVEAFQEGAESGGHSVSRFDLQKMDIHYCLGCYGGGQDAASPCVQKDDMDKIYPIYREADIVVLATPMYYWSFSAQLKAALDRLFAVVENSNDYKSPYKECMLLMPAGDESEENFTPVINYYESLLGFLGWKDLGRVLAGGLLYVGDIEGKACLAQAKALGASIV